MRNYSISVVIPAYNCENSIIRCLNSVFNQTRLNLIKEVIIVNDGSQDNTDKIIKNIKKPPVNLQIINQENRGVSCARNIGINQASGEWIAFLDSDDEWIESKLEIQEKVIDEFDVFMVGGNISGKVQKVGLFNTSVKEVINVNTEDMLIRSFPQTSTVLVKSIVFKELKFDEKQSFSEDLNLFTKICYKFNFYHINKQLVVYGNGKNQISKHTGLSSNIKEMNNGAKKNLHDFLLLGIISKPKYYIYYLFNQIKYLRRIIKYILS